MPVTDLLSALRPGATRSRRHRVATRAVAVSAAVGASLGVLAAANPDEASAPAAAETSASSSAIQYAAFDPAPAPEAVAWGEHRAAQEAVPPPPAPEPVRPHTVRPVEGRLTSTFGARWGAQHNGLDFGDPIGAPIFSVTDGVVIETGPASGFGLWVRVQQDDGTVGVYGHVNDILVEVGQQVSAGDVIATVGNRGQSTGPHLHYEVHDPALGPIDPMPWLAARGIHVGFAEE
ncbi:M23 family metallopeptidase [Nocardia amikacinitolerans]|uniref:M23 family metallopeptidase n=1 Tax=Nocardia amikacinitolerans TaxID=756689 RepID=UPI0020A5A590|nr:M23 family metallopeptidase [Nocardia amikacinitolerans]MCP2278010.1 Murein DD-endopeptidase MepM and murein hydrolase activator NlpD, containing LysM domain [Nocardia amikacinitolerans]MCP2296585.1 Murein DD-endopeptidase MepM and murein hydrolase activator NlpD, containing LysM domain [Nocardia amikacinitolerans]